MPNSGVNTSYYNSCCGQFAGSKNALGHGQVSNVDPLGRTVHSAAVADYDTHTNPSNPIDAKTLAETTTRYRDDGRIAATTTWKQALGAIDPLSPPIAGLDGIAATQGITTQYVYDNRVSDGFGLDSSAGITINRLGVGTASVNIQAALTKLADTVANGGADVTFASSRSGKATVAISPVEKTMNVSIQDAMGRTVFQGLMSGPAASTPNQLLSWNSVGMDKTYTLSGVGLCEATWRIMQDGKYVQSVSNGLGQSVATLDQLAKLSRNKYNAAGNLLQQIDPLSNTTNFEYDLLGKRPPQAFLTGSLSWAGLHTPVSQERNQQCPMRKQTPRQSRFGKPGCRGSTQVR
jgi:YD repeat-containing protein